MTELIELQKEAGYKGYKLYQEKSLKEFLKLGQANVNGAYSFMVKNLLPEVIGKTAWKNKSMQYKLSTFSNKLDEGFCLVCLENYWNRWWDEALHKGDKNYRSSKNNLYTCDSIGKNALENEGWNLDGRTRFIVICNDIDFDRHGPKKPEDVNKVVVRRPLKKSERLSRLNWYKT